MIKFFVKFILFIGVMFLSLFLALILGSAFASPLDNKAFKTAALIFAADEICLSGSGELDEAINTFVNIGILQETVTNETAAIIVTDHTVEIIEYVITNDTVTEFCTNMVKGNW